MSIQNKVVTHDNLLNFLGEIVASGKELYAPQRKGLKTYFHPVNDVQTIVFDYIQTTLSPKSLLFPKVERLLSYTRDGKQIHVTDSSEQKQAPDRILFGSRPCDAAGLQIVTEFFLRDTSDTYIQRRQNALMIISVSCVKSNEYCFCTSVGILPGDTKGSDILLTPIENGRYFVEIVTEKGGFLLAQYEKYFEQSEATVKEQYLVNVTKTFSSTEISERLAEAFDNPLWKDASLRCIGCGTCAYVCPVCSCFDIQDEGTNKKGDRLRCWDSCAFSLFTLHTSGHNPRSTQSERWRQRVMHKFSYMPEQLGMLGCVGCGRCSLSCPADMNIKEQLVDFVSTVPVAKK
jgi:formate hydrogenlyase subunit 6/NADH:ubiquinone oxidoreductase subunit I